MTKSELVVLLSGELATIKLQDSPQERRKKAEKIIALLEDLRVLSLDKPVETKLNTIWKGN